MDNLPKVHFTKSEAAQYLCLSTQEIDNLCFRGELQRAKLGDARQSRVIFRRCDLDDFVERHLQVRNETEENAEAAVS